MDMNKENNTAPECIGIIMDGNRRWAKAQGKPAIFGHHAGYEKLKETVLWAKEAGVSYLIAYAFSTENWKRSQEEVGALRGLFREAFSRDDFFKKEGIRVSFIGERQRLDDDIQTALTRIENETVASNGTHLLVALSYGGRAEIVSAIKRIPPRALADINEETFAEYLWTKGVPDPDIIIRTGGDKRLSNFLPWQSVYSEFFFIDTFWPAFSKEEFSAILAEYNARERRKGI